MPCQTTVQEWRRNLRHNAGHEAAKVGSAQYSITEPEQSSCLLHWELKDYILARQLLVSSLEGLNLPLCAVPVLGVQVHLQQHNTDMSECLVPGLTVTHRARMTGAKAAAAASCSRQCSMQKTTMTQKQKFLAVSKSIYCHLHVHDTPYQYDCNDKAATTNQ